MARLPLSTLAFAAAAVVVTSCPAPAGADTPTYNISLTVPVLCRISYSGSGAGGSVGDAVDLGELKEFCNAGSGYSVIVDYSPGTLRGAVLQLGDDRVVLDGSGEAVISAAPGPRIRARRLLATPGANGFDTQQLSFEMRTGA